MIGVSFVISYQLCKF